MAAKRYPRKTTKREFTRFVAECNRLKPLFGLQSWKLTFRHQELENGQLARADFGSKSRCATIRMTNMLYTDIAEELYISPEVCARHEMTHLLTGRLEYLACDRFATEEQIDDEIEVLARILEKFKLIPDSE